MERCHTTRFLMFLSVVVSVISIIITVFSTCFIIKMLARRNARVKVSCEASVEPGSFCKDDQQDTILEDIPEEEPNYFSDEELENL